MEVRFTFWTPFGKGLHFTHISIDSSVRETHLMLADQWFYRLDGRPHGPFTLAQFEKLVRVHAVAPDTEVSTDGQNWKPIRAALADAPPDLEPPTNADWMNAPTLLPGDPAMRLKPDPKPPQ